MSHDLSQTEENYLKTIYQLSEKQDTHVTTNEIAKLQETSAASVTDMLKKLADKQLIHYEKYKGVLLTTEGNRIATALIRKHRLWEYFLVENLAFEWDEVHVIAEELEHIKSDRLTDRLDEYLGHPRYDPHGDPIPDKEGRYAYRSELLLKDFEKDQEGIVVGVKNSNDKFLQYLDSVQLTLGSRIKILEWYSFDHSMLIELDQDRKLNVSNEVSQNLYVKPA